MEKLLTKACKREAHNLDPRVAKARGEVEEAYKKYSKVKTMKPCMLSTRQRKSSCMEHMPKYDRRN